MNHRNQWQALSTRIHGLLQAAQYHAALLAAKASDSYGRGKYLRGHCIQVRDALLAYRKSFRQFLPPAAAIALDHFLDDLGKCWATRYHSRNCARNNCKPCFSSLLHSTAN
jgi:hypothetical protein